MSKDCHWAHNEEGYWETTCGDIFEVTEGTPSENNMRFCCYCGKRLVEVEIAEAEDHGGHA